MYLVDGNLTEEQVTELKQSGCKMAHFADETVFVCDMREQEVSIINRPVEGYVDEKNRIANARYHEMVKGMKKNYPDNLSLINVNRLLFVEDIEWERKEKATENSAWKIQIQKAPKLVHDTIGIDYILKTRKWWTDKMSDSQIAAMIMAELLRINSETGAIKKLTSESYSPFTSTFGAKWLEKGAGNIPDVSKVKVDFVGLPTADGQQSLFRVCEINGPIEE